MALVSQRSSRGASDLCEDMARTISRLDEARQTQSLVENHTLLQIDHLARSSRHVAVVLQIHFGHASLPSTLKMRRSRRETSRLQLVSQA